MLGAARPSPVPSGSLCGVDLSTQDTFYQREAAERLHLLFLLLSDEHLTFTRAMRLPAFETSGMTLLKRVTLVIKDGIIYSGKILPDQGRPKKPRCSCTLIVFPKTKRLNPIELT